jgi:2-polyprenyl-3-methyl-5-hydroxy-6-metoxy-1,4-benzoquinol methylase
VSRRDPTERVKREFSVRSPHEAMPLAQALERVEAALAEWRAPTKAAAQAMFDTLQAAHPDQHAPDDFWHSAASKGFRDFFVWGHDHDFGHGVRRSGAMGARHKEITSESMSLGMLPADLGGAEVLDVGCWSGGDLLILAGLGARVTAIEEHPLAAAAARRLCALVGCPAEILSSSLYADRLEWKRKFDLVYCSGVIYHVTDPLLLLRICFAYLKTGGRLVIETKMMEGDGSACSYSGIVEKGWNWYAPTREAMGRWLADAGFEGKDILVHRRPMGRLLASAVKSRPAALPESAGFSRPGSWLEGEI